MFIIVVWFGEKRLFLPKFARPFDIRGVFLRVGEGLCLGAIACAVLEIYFSGRSVFIEADFSQSSFLTKVSSGVGFSAMNALLEEGLWRVLLMLTLLNGGGSKWESNFVQAFTFGLAHLAGGIPDGVPGVLLAMSFGLTNGAFVLFRTHGLVAAVTAHFVVDLFIFSKAVFQLQLF